MRTETLRCIVVPFSYSRTLLELAIVPVISPKALLSPMQPSYFLYISHHGGASYEASPPLIF